MACPAGQDRSTLRTATLATILAIAASSCTVQDPPRRPEVSVPPPPECPTTPTLATLSRAGVSPSGYQAQIVPNKDGHQLFDLKVIGPDGSVVLFVEKYFGPWYAMNVMWDEKDNLWLYSNDFGLVYYARVVSLDAPPCQVPSDTRVDRWEQCYPREKMEPPRARATPPAELTRMIQQELWCSSRD